MREALGICIRWYIGNYDWIQQRVIIASLTRYVLVFPSSYIQDLLVKIFVTIITFNQ